jgi:hypothetical protein
VKYVQTRSVEELVHRGQYVVALRLAADFEAARSGPRAG